MLRDPITIPPEMTVREVHRAAARSTRSPACRWSKDGKVVGIVTNRDLRFETKLDQPVQRDHDAAASSWSPCAKAPAATRRSALMHKHRLERVLVVNERLRAARA